MEGGKRVIISVYTYRCTVTTRISDSCIKMGSDESRFSSLIVRNNVTRQCPQTGHNLSEDIGGEPKRNRTQFFCGGLPASVSPYHLNSGANLPLLHVYTPSRALRSSSDIRMLEIQQYKRKTHGFRTFSCFGPHVWNSLPHDLRHCSILSSLKAKLKTFLFSQYFHPN